MILPDSNAGVCLGRLRIRAPASSDAQALRRDLDAQVWPSAPDGSWVLLRELDVQGTRPEIARRVVAGVDELIRGAVDGLGPGASSAAAVRFRDLGELLAALCSDLAAGRAATLWYWRSWSALFGRTPGDAIASLLDRHPAYLTTLTGRLDARGDLAPVWGALSDDQAMQLLGRLAAWSGLELSATLADGPAPAAIDRQPLPAHLIQRWEPALAGLRPEDGRALLAAGLVALEWRPLLLGPGTSSCLAALSSALTGEDPIARSRTRSNKPADPSMSAPRPRSTPDTEPGGPTDASAMPGDQERDRRPGHRIHPYTLGLGQNAERHAHTGRSPPVVPFSDGTGGSIPLPHVRIGDPVMPRSPTSAEASVGSSSPAVGQPLDRVVPPQVRFGSRYPATSVPGGEHGTVALGDAILQEAVRSQVEQRANPVETDQGGLFFLINFLSRPEAQALIAANEGFARVPDGWHWLWDLGRRHGLRDCGPLADFLVERLGLGEAAELADLPGVPGAMDLLDLGRRLYPADALWGPDLLLVQARIHYSPSHLELDFPISAVRLPVRLVGLDLDPGWVPWLGRVVHFRYLDDWRDAVPIGSR